MKMRLSGTEAEIDAFIDSLREHYEIISVSAFYPDRGPKVKESKAGRCYVEIGQRSKERQEK